MTKCPTCGGEGSIHDPTCPLRVRKAHVRMVTLASIHGGSLELQHPDRVLALTVDPRDRWPVVWVLTDPLEGERWPS